MPILLPVEAKNTKGRLIYAGVFIALIIGSLTMVYPFAIMISGSLRSEMDEADMDLVPRFLIDQETLARKFLEVKYNYNVADANQARGFTDFSFRQMTVPEEPDERAIANLQRFFEEVDPPRHWQNLGAMEEENKRVSRRLRDWRQELERRYEGNLQALSEDLGAPIQSWLTLEMDTPDWLNHRFNLEDAPTYNLYFELLEQAPVAERWTISLTGYYLEQMIFPEYGSTEVDQYNEAHVDRIESYEAFRLPREAPGEDRPQAREHWADFVRETLNASFIVVEDVPTERFQDFLRQRYDGIEGLNNTWDGVDLAAFDEIPLPDGRTWLNGSHRGDYADFLETVALEDLRLVGPEYAWADWLAERYGTIERYNTEHGTSHGSFEQVQLPLADAEAQYVADRAGSLRWEYATRNFVNVFDELLLQGRPFINTIIFVTLAVVLSLLLNPLAAYAMSRFKLPGTFKFLLILMATIAFPPMVAFIPQFLALRTFGLLNTFIALLLPTVVNGYLIFLLKGFFDSLPSELYDAAQIDGASEIRMFFQITMSLSKPILAVVGLQAFNQAYMMFLYALIVTPDEKMWILSVWLYQYQQEASSAAVFASVLIASIPTLTVFLLVQRIIMRGIVIPTEK